jgi:glucokinase
VDLGGTKIMAGVFDAKLDCLGQAKKKTKAVKGFASVVDRIQECVEEALQAASISVKQVAGVGIGAPGSVDPAAGRVIFAPNLGWRDVPFQKQVEERLSVPVFLENDCNLCTLGVHAVEFSGKPRHMVGIFLGTGIGAGIVIGGKLYCGSNFTAGEIGHMVLDVNGPPCGCGNRGCFEAFASRTGIFNRILAAIGEGQETIIGSMLGEDMQDLRSGKLRKAIQAGDKYVAEVVRDAARYTGVAVANVINLLNPECIVLGGGLIEQLENHMLDLIITTARKHAMAGAMRGVRIQSSRLADEAGVVGGAVLARSRTT